MIAVFGTSICSIMPFCHFASQITYKLKLNGYRAYQSFWYKLPLDHQQEIKFMIAYAQIIRKFSGWGMIDCSNEVFLKVSLNKTHNHTKWTNITDRFSPFIYRLYVQLFLTI